MIYPSSNRSMLLKEMEKRATLMASRKNLPNRRRCFVSYHVDDQVEVQNFIDTFGDDFIFKCLGVTDEDNFVDSVNEETIRRVIREKYLTNTSVTIVLVGKCTKSRKFVDWEIASSLRDDPKNKRSGIVAIPLPSLNNSWSLPSRLKANYKANDSAGTYVIGRKYPTSSAMLRSYVEEAILKRDNKYVLVDNTLPLLRRNGTC